MNNYISSFIVIAMFALLIIKGSEGAYNGDNDSTTQDWLQGQFLWKVTNYSDLADPSASYWLFTDFTVMQYTDEDVMNDLPVIEHRYTYSRHGQIRYLTFDGVEYIVMPNEHGQIELHVTGSEWPTHCIFLSPIQ